MTLVQSILTGRHGPSNGDTLLQQWYWVPLLIAVLLVVILLYKAFIPRLSKVKQTESLEETVAQTVEKETRPPIAKHETPEDAAHSTIAVALRLLETDERKVVEALLEGEGVMLQKDISWKTGFSRVKTHRILVRLIRRGVVTSEKYYNTNKISLSDWILQANKAGHSDSNAT